MEQIEEETPLYTVVKVLEEMQQAEENLLSWNIGGWWETYEKTVIDEEYFDIPSYDEKIDFTSEESKIRLNNATYEYSGIPLKCITIENKYNCQVIQITWSKIITNSSSRTIEFSNNGDIALSKCKRKKTTKKHPEKVKYDIRYNVLTNDFEMSSSQERFISPGISEENKIFVSLQGDILTKKYNDIEIIEDLTTGKKIIKIAKEKDENSNASIVFEVTMDKDVLSNGFLEIKTHKGNGKVNGTYRINVSPKKGVRANFYSRKGIKVDLTTNPLLMNNARLLLPAPAKDDSKENGLKVVTNFVDSTEETIQKSLSDRPIIFDTTSFNMNTILEAEDKITEMLKKIKGESPLNGLVSKIDNYLSLTQNNKMPKDDKQKILVLESNN